MRESFGVDLDRLVPTGALGVAVSGGPDSLALLLLAAETRPGGVIAATVDHGLRTVSAGEAAMVAGVCAGLGVAHHVLKVEVGAGASLQAQARAARYEALGRWARAEGLAAIATAHHADDQAETLLMRLARGSGVGGLSGIRERRALADGVDLVRPLLGARKGELEAIVAAAGLTPVCDPANADVRHDRTRVRALLANTEWLDPVRLARSAAALAEAEEALAERVEALAVTQVAVDADGVWLTPCRFPRELRRRLLARALAAAGVEAPRGSDLERVMGEVEAGRATTLGAMRIAPVGGRWRIAPAPPRRG